MANAAADLPRRSTPGFSNFMQQVSDVSTVYGQDRVERYEMAQKRAAQMLFRIAGPEGERDKDLLLRLVRESIATEDEIERMAAKLLLSERDLAWNVVSYAATASNVSEEDTELAELIARLVQHCHRLRFAHHG